MFKLLNSIRDAEAVKHAGRVNRYRGILEKGDSATPDDLREITVLMEELGKSSSDVKKDLDRIGERRRLTAIAVTLAASEAESVRTIGVKNIRVPAIEEQIKKLQEERQAIIFVSEDASAKFCRVQQASQRLPSFEHENADLFFPEAKASQQTRDQCMLPR